MAVTTILVDSDRTKIQGWTDYIGAYNRETSKTAALDLTGLGTPQTASGETMEEVLDLMGKTSGGIALIYAHANANGLIMRITTGANCSASSKYLRGISRAWKAIDEIIRLRSGDWSNPSKPKFLIDVAGAVKLFTTLQKELRELGGAAGDLADPSTVTNREQADAWFDRWMELMGRACLGGGLGETELRRVCRAMQKVRDLRFERVEIRACNIGKDKGNLDALKEFFGAGLVVAPKVTMFFGKAAVNLNPGGNINQLVTQLGGFRGNRFAPPGVQGHKFNSMPGGEAEMRSGKRNRILPERGQPDVIMQVTEDRPFHFPGRLFSTDAAAMTRFLQANYKAGGAFSSAGGGLAVGGMWTAKEPKSQVPFVLPLEAAYRDLLETSS